MHVRLYTVFLVSLFMCIFITGKAKELAIYIAVKIFFLLLLLIQFQYFIHVKPIQVSYHLEGGCRLDRWLLVIFPVVVYKR